MKAITSIIIFSALLIACRKEANIKLPETKSLPVIYSFICPEDSLLRVKVTASQPLYQSSGTDIYSPITNAIVEIRGEQGNARFIYNVNTEYYELNSSSYPLAPGKTYKLNVTMANGDVAFAETQIPLTQVAIDKITYEIIKDQYSESKNFKVSFTDESGKKNYYSLSVAAISNGLLGDTLYSDCGIRTLFDDVNRDGEYTTLSGRYYYYESDTIKIYEAYLLNCTTEFHKYHLSLQNYSGDNPFSEPTLIYNNIKGGFGNFSSYRKSRKRITI